MPLDHEKWKRDAKDVILRWERDGREPTPAMYAMIEACEDIEELKRIARTLADQLEAAVSAQR